jgi:hypothetical protein
VPFVPERFFWRVVFPTALAAAGLAVALVRHEGLATVAIATALALGHLVPLRVSSGRLQPVGPAVLAASALGHLLVPAACGAALGLPIGWALARVRFGERRSADLLVGEGAGAAAFLALFCGLDLLAHRATDAWVHLAMLLPPAAGWYLASAAARTGWSESRRRVSGSLLWKTALQEWPAYLVLVAAGGLYGFTAEALGPWAVLLAALPYGFAHLAFGRLATASATHRQTIRALGRVPEAGGFSLPGHAERSADIAVAMGGELKLPPREIRRLEDAALLVDIGRVVLGAPALASGGGFTTADLAGWSATIIAEAPTMQPVATLVAESPRPYRRPGEARDASLPLAAQVVKVATAYDYAVGGGMEAGDALEVLHRGVAYDYDPEVLAALRRVLQRRGYAGV